MQTGPRAPSGSSHQWWWRWTGGLLPVRQQYKCVSCRASPAL